MSFRNKVRNLCIKTTIILYCMLVPCIAGAQTRTPLTDLHTTSTTYEQKAQYPLTSAGKQLIHNIQHHQQLPGLITRHNPNQAICAGYLYELSKILRGPTAPNYFGMLHPQDREPAHARELPYTYRYRGGRVSFDLGDIYGPVLQADPSQYRSLIKPQDILAFAASVFASGNYLSDIGFLYQDTNYRHLLGTYGNYNSHIAKNVGLTAVTLPTDITADDLTNPRTIDTSTLQQALNCPDHIRPKLLSTLQHYTRFVNDHPAHIDPQNRLRYDVSTTKNNKAIDYTKIMKKTKPQTLTITYPDIILLHFFQHERVDTLLSFLCQDQFYPINTININPNFIGQ